MQIRSAGALVRSIEVLIKSAGALIRTGVLCSFNNWSYVVLQLYEFSNILFYNRAFLATLCVHDIL